MKVTAKDFRKYKNPDTHCEYSFTAEPVGYCFSYAHHVDGTPGFEDLIERCRYCDCWNPTGKPAKKP